MLTKIERNDVRNVIAAFLTAYGSLAFLSFLVLVDVWAHGAPASADPTRGHVYPHNEHGWITYFTAFQATSSALLFWTSIPIVFLGILISPKRNIVYRRGCLSFAANWDQDDPKNLQRVGAICGAVAAPIIVFLAGPHLVSGLNAAGVVWSLG